MDSNTAKNREAIGKLLDKVNRDLDKGNAPSPAILEALKTLVQLTSPNFQID